MRPNRGYIGYLLFGSDIWELLIVINTYKMRLYAVDDIDIGNGIVSAVVKRQVWFSVGGIELIAILIIVIDLAGDIACTFSCAVGIKCSKAAVCGYMERCK